MGVTGSPRRGGGYAAVLRNRSFLTLWAGQAVSNVGDVVARIALLLWVTGHDHSPLAVAAVMASMLLPFVLVGPVAGVLVDRWDKKACLIGADLTRAVLVLGIAAAHALWQVVGLSFAMSLAGLFFGPARQAVLPEITGRDEYLPAVALSQTTSQVTNVVGPGVAGLLVAATGLGSAFILDAVTFLVSAAAILAVPFPALPTSGRHRRGLLGELEDGLGTVREVPALRLAVGLLAGAILVLSLQNIILVVYLRDWLHLGAARFGLVQSASAVGAVVGAIVTGQLFRRARRLPLVAAGLLGTGLASIYFFTAPGFIGVTAWAAVDGASGGVIQAPTQALLAEETPVERRGRVFALFGSLVHVSALLGLAVAAPLAAWLGPAVSLGSVGVALVILVTALWARGSFAAVPPSASSTM